MVEGDECPVVQDADTITHSFGFLEVVGGENDGDAFVVPQLADNAPDLGAHRGVKTDCWLVEKQHARVRQQAAGDLDASPQAAAQRTYTVLGTFGQAEPVEQRRDAGVGGLGAHAPEPGVQPEVLDDAEFIVEHAVLEHDADPASHPQRIAPHVDTVDKRVPRRRAYEGRQDPDARALPSTVRPEKSEDLALLDDEGQVP
jgi:hypothetical protein